jgi:hypothetical protein
VHDSVWFEINGKPAVVIASSVFEDAAEKQAAALGLPEAKRVFVPHPIQDATDDEMRAKADGIVAQIVAALKN